MGGQTLQWERLVAGALAVILHFLSHPNSMSFILFISRPCLLRRGKRRVPRPASMWEDVVRQMMSRGAVVFRHEQALFALISKPCQEAVWWCIQVMPRGCFASTWIGFLKLFSLETNKIRWGGGMRLIHIISKHTFYLHVQEKGALTGTVMTRSKVFSRAECYRVWDHCHTFTCIIDKVLMIRLMRLRA